MRFRHIITLFFILVFIIQNIKLLIIRYQNRAKNYTLFKDFFEKIVEKQGEQIVLKKV